MAVKESAKWFSFSISFSPKHRFKKNKYFYSDFKM